MQKGSRAIEMWGAVMRLPLGVRKMRTRDIMSPGGKLENTFP